MIAAGAGGSASSVAPYLVSDVTLDDDGTFRYAFKGTFTGAGLRSPGLPVDLRTNTSRGKAFWIERASGTGPQVQYADERVTSWTAQPSGGDLTVQLTGTPGPATFIVANPGTNRGRVRTVTLGAQGTATVTVKATDLTAPA